MLMRHARPTVQVLSSRLIRPGSVLVVFVLAVSLASCSKGAAGSAPGAGTGEGRGTGAGRGGRGAGGGAAVVVTTGTVVEKPMAVEVRTVGNVEASSSVDVRSQVTGELVGVEFAEGQDVKAGQVLFRIDPRPFEVAVRQAEAALARSTAQAKGMAAQLARSEELLKQGLSARADRDNLATQMAMLQAATQSDTAQLENARLQLRYTTIASPVDGRTGALLVNRGALVRPNDPTPLVVINQVTPAYISFAVPARLLPQVRSDQGRGALKVQAVPAGTNEAAATGAVTFTDNTVNSSSDTIRLKATFPNRDRRFWAGAFVDVTLQLSVNPRAVVVPNAAVQASQQGQFVYIVKADATVEVRPITVAWIDGNEVVVEKGVAPGETVVTDGQLRLTPGAKVTTKPAEGQPRTTS